MSNVEEDLFTAKFFMGGKKEMNAIIDTATDFVAVEGKGCSNCNWHTYDIQSNVNAGTASVEMGTKTVSYGISEFQGQQANDKFCFELNKCYQVDFLLLSSQTGLDPSVDGILGFARPN